MYISLVEHIRASSLKYSLAIACFFTSCSILFIFKLYFSIPALILLFLSFAIVSMIQENLKGVARQIAVLHQQETLQSQSVGDLEAVVAERTRELVKLNSELLLAKDLAESAVASKATFLTHMSASFRTPLMGILLYSDLIQEAISEESSPDTKQLLLDISRIQESANQLLKNIDQVLDFAQLELKNTVTLDIKSVNTADILFDIRTFLETFSQVNNNSFEVFIGVIPGSINTDYPKLKHILASILDNAFKFTQRGLITVRVDSDMKTLTFVISDTGCGIPLDKLETIYTGLSSSICRGEESLGLSLTLAKRYIQFLGGNLLLRTEVNQGTCVTIKLPISISGKNTFSSCESYSEDFTHV